MDKKENLYSVKQLRKMIKNNEISHEALTEENYSDIFEYEIERRNPDIEILNFCTNGLMKFDAYRELQNISIDIDKLTRKYINHENKNVKNKKIYRLVIIFTTVFVLFLSLQMVSLAFGYNFFGYIFNWFEEQLFIENKDERSISFETEPYFEDYYNLDSIPEQNRLLIPDILINEYQFIKGDFSIYPDGSTSLFISFYIENDINLTFSFLKGNNRVYEKDDVYYEEYKYNDIAYYIFSNYDYYGVIWTIEEYMYHINVNMSVDEIKKLIHAINKE